MTPSEALKKADALAVAVRGDRMATGPDYRIALATCLQQVSDAVKRAIERTNPCHRINIKVELEPFILSEPVDPLGEVLRSVGWAKAGHENTVADNFRTTLAKRGLKIVKEET